MFLVFSGFLFLVLRTSQGFLGFSLGTSLVSEMFFGFLYFLVSSWVYPTCLDQNLIISSQPANPGCFAGLEIAHPKSPGGPPGFLWANPRDGFGVVKVADVSCVVLRRPPLGPFFFSKTQGKRSPFLLILEASFPGPISI